MGSGYSFKCSKCGEVYEVMTGIGRMYPVHYKETMDAILKGEHGEEWKSIAESTEYVAANCEEELYRCRCGHWEVAMVLDLYAPKDAEKIKIQKYGEKNAEEWGYVPYVSEYDLQDDYVLLRAYKHICPDCGSEMKKSSIRISEKCCTKLKCPACGTPNPADPGGLIMWD